MKLVTAFDLAVKNESQLQGLLREGFNSHVICEPDSHVRDYLNLTL